MNVKESIKNIGKWLLKGINWLMKPVIDNFNYFLVIWAINCSVTIGYVVGVPFIEANELAHGLRSLALGTFVCYLLTVGLHLCRKRVLRIIYKCITYFVVVLLEAVYIFVNLNFDMGIDARLFTLLAETTSSETAEFIKTYALAGYSLVTYAIVVGIIIVVILVECGKKWINSTARHKASRVIFTILFLPLIIAGAWYSHNYVKMATCKHSKDLTNWVSAFGNSALDNITSLVYSLNYVNTSHADVAEAVASARKVYETPVSITEPDSLMVVMVFGESYIKSHASLYGYEHNTTPYLIEERDRGNLIVFNDMVSPYNATSTVQKNFFSLNDMSQNEYWYEKPMFTTVFKHAGYNVYIWDMQREYQKTELYTISVNSLLYNDTIAKLSYDEQSSTPFEYDGNMVAHFRDHSQVPQGKYNLVIFHLKGQHVNPAYRYPKGKGYAMFTADSVHRNDKWLTKEKKDYIAHYDNATVYNDAVLEGIFNLWRDKNAVVVYLPDHGDEAYDFRDHCGRNGARNFIPEFLHCDNDVPFMVWCSDTFIARHPELVAQMRSAVDRPGISLDVSMMLLRLGGIKTPYYDATRDISSPQFKVKKRIVYDSCDYDEVIKKEKKEKEEEKEKNKNVNKLLNKFHTP